jgi:hypothetical protein
MRAPANDIIPAKLRDVIAAEYGFEIALPQFLPKGEDAFVYRAQAAGGRQLFIRVEARSQMLENVCAIREAFGLDWVVTALRTRTGRLAAPYLHYTVAVFPFIEGCTAHESGMTPEELAKAGHAIAGLHGSKASIELPRERFANPFANTIRTLQELPANTEAARLFRDTRESVNALSERVEVLSASLRAQDVAMVLTHGDPNLANWIIDPKGRLHLADWGDLGYGPPERDLFAFTPDRFAEFLRSYISAGGTRRLDARIFEFYFDRWRLQDIAEYGERLFKSDQPDEIRHAWAGLRRYLPLREDTRPQFLANVQEALAAIAHC